MNKPGMASNDNPPLTEVVSLFQKFRSIRGLYRWFGWLILGETGILAIALFVDIVLGAPLIGGLLAAVGAVIGIGVILTVLGIASLRITSRFT